MGLITLLAIANEKKIQNGALFCSSSNIKTVIYDTDLLQEKKNYKRNVSQGRLAKKTLSAGHFR